MADGGAAQPGWRLKMPNMQPVTPVTSYMMWILQFGLMCSWIPPADLWHMNKSGCSKLLKAAFRGFDVRTSCIFCELLNSLRLEYHWVNWLYCNVSELYFINIRNTLQIVCLLVRNFSISYIFLFHIYTYIHIRIDMSSELKLRYLCFVLFTEYYIHMKF